MNTPPSRQTADAALHDGSRILVSIFGTGPAVLLPVRTAPHPADEAETMRQWGADPDHGPTLVAGLRDRFTVVTADYEGHRLNHPAAGTLTPDQLTADLLALADAAGVHRFAYYGYSWLALAGLQLALRTDRLAGLAMGGFPARRGPYREMLAVTSAALTVAEASVDAPRSNEVELTPGDWDSATGQTDPAQPRQFVTLYEALQDFDDAAALTLDVPRLCFAGSEDDIDYPPRWGGVRVGIADGLRRSQDELETAGWLVRLLPGLDHLAAMHGGVVLDVLRPALERWVDERGW